MTAYPDLVQFLRDRLLDDALHATAAQVYDIAVDEEDLPPARLVVEPAYENYVTHFTPARTLADVHAKQWLVDLLAVSRDIPPGVRKAMLEEMARPYRHHAQWRHVWPDLPVPVADREEWRP